MESFSPHIIASPLLGLNNPVKMLIKVVFPAPLWPKIEKSSLSDTSKYEFFKAHTSYFPVKNEPILYVFEIPISLIPSAETPSFSKDLTFSHSSLSQSYQPFDAA